MIYEMPPDVPYFEFFSDVIEDREASEDAGHYVAKDIDLIRLTPKGGKSVVEEHYDSWIAKKRKLAQGGQYDMTFVEHVEKRYRS